jgi:hypothetical protein
MHKWDFFLRTQKKKFILAEALGPAGYVFVDFGDSHQISDATGE